MNNLPERERILKRFDELIATGKNMRLMEGDITKEKRAKLIAWEVSCCNLLEKVFSKESDYYRVFKRAGSVPNLRTHPTNCTAIMENAKKDFKEGFDVIKKEKAITPLAPLTLIEQICSRFHLVARQLRDRHNDRTTLDVSDEYDVQDLLYALLRIHFDDIRPEVWTPDYAGGSSRMDFLLKNEGIVIETKKTRVGLGPKELGDQLIVDIDRYKEYPDCKILFCFVYDPEGRVTNPEGFEKDLSKKRDEIIVRVLIAPKGV